MNVMGRKKRESTEVHGIRLPARLWDKLSQIAGSEYRTKNAQIWKIVEDWLVSHKHMKDKDRTK